MPTTNTATPNNLLTRWQSIILIVVVSAVILLLGLDTYPAAWFDEGYKANGARTLAERGVYGTYTANGYIPFDPGLSSGPVDMSLMAVTFATVGRGVVQMRLSSVLFTLLAVVALYTIARQLYGSQPGLIILLFVLAFPAIGDTGFLLIGRQALSEPAALALIAGGLAVWFGGWDTPRWYIAVAAGLLMGLGLLSKTQYAIPLLPAIFVVSVAYILHQRSDVVYFGVTLFAIVFVIGAWMGLGRILTPPEIAQENTAMLLDAIQTNLITGLWGRTLTTTALIVIGIMVFGAASAAWRLRGQGLNTSRQWAELTIIAFVSLTVIWHALFSIGWPRYAYVGLVFGLLLVGKWVYDRLSAWLPGLMQRTVGIIAALVLIALVTNIAPILLITPDSDAEAISDYVDDNIPTDAIIETWEWELTVLSDHWQYHLPHQRYLFEAIRQFSHEQRLLMTLDYDPLQADPDYLIVGPFATFTNIYTPDLETHFEHVTSMGEYHLYERIEENSAS